MISVAMFYHSLVSDWNHGNAHFLRGIASELLGRGHEVRIFEPQDSWSRSNLLAEAGPGAIEAFQRAFPKLTSATYEVDQLDLDRSLDGVDLILVHEWNDPKVISAAARYRRRNPSVRLLFHDTHHRALTAEEELSRFDLADYDGILAYGAALKQIYESRGWGKQVYVWHEAADIRTFYPRNGEMPLSKRRAPRARKGKRRAPRARKGDVVWIGNWGDEERTEEMREYFVLPVKRLSLQARVYGVRYPDAAIHELNNAGISYAGWLPNFKVPEVFAQFRATVHVPRRPYTRELPGIPTIRPFEALACGIPLICAPWQDTEGLFRVGQDFLMAKNGPEMQKYLEAVLRDPALRHSLSASGLETIRSRHTCAHRVDELLSIYHRIQPAPIEKELAVCAGAS